MRKEWLGVAAAALLGGCTVVDNVSYPVTSFAEIPLKDKAKIRIVSRTPAADPVVAGLKAEFGKSKACSVVEAEADYWFVVDRAAQASDVSSFKALSVVSQETGGGSQDVLQEGVIQTSSAATAVSVAVYETRSLAPVHYLEVPMYDGDAKVDARQASVYEAGFAKDVVERVKDAFLTQEKKVDVPVPCKTSPALMQAMAAGDYAAVMQAYDAKGIDVHALCDEMAAGTYKGELKQDEILADYAVYLMAKETQTSDPEELGRLRTEHLFVIETCEDKGLAEAVPVALARLDYKLAHLGE